jgi:hypothetical protein
MHLVTNRTECPAAAPQQPAPQSEASVHLGWQAAAARGASRSSPLVAALVQAAGMCMRVLAGVDLQEYSTWLQHQAAPCTTLWAPGCVSGRAAAAKCGASLSST